LDTVATELFLESAQLLSSVRRLLRLMGVELQTATPAVAELLATLSSPTVSALSNYIQALAEFETSDIPPITFEASEEGLDLDRTDQVSYVYGLYAVETSTGSASVSTGSDIITRTTGSWSASLVEDEIVLSGSIVGNTGRYRITEKVSATQARVVKVSDGDDPGFSSEDSLDWRRMTYTSNFATLANGPGAFIPLPSIAALDEIYIAHSDVLVDQVDVAFDTPANGVVGVWEYYDNKRSLFNPSEIVNNGSTLSFDLTTLLGANDVNGALIKVTYLKTGEFEEGVSGYSDLGGGDVNSFTSQGLFGQVNVSELLTDYHITAEWIPFIDIEDNTLVSGENLEADGSISWELPQNLERSWHKTQINNIEAMWFRFRVVSISTPTTPVFNSISIDQGTQYILFDVTQGRTVGPEIIGSSDGSAAQEFRMPDVPYLDETETIEVDEGGAGTFIEWSYVDSFLASTPSSRHYIRQVSDNKEGVIIFGDGVNGKIPPAGTDNIQATYRVGGDEVGNVGAEQITSNADGVPGLSAVTNPRSAIGWRINEGGDFLDLRRVKRAGPAKLRAKGTGSNSSDIEYLAINNFTDSSGIKAVSRAVAVEEGFGVKTVKLLVVGINGEVLTDSQLVDLKEYFNGNRNITPPTTGVISLNQQVFPVNYEPIQISISVTVAWDRGSEEQVKNALLGLLRPFAIEPDGVTYTWDFGGQVSYSRVHSVVHEVSSEIKDVRNLNINGLEQSYQLSANELPVTTASDITVVIVST